MSKKPNIKNTPKWKTFEESTAHTSAKIFNKETVLANQKVKGILSEVLRQIDVKVGENEFIDIECKDHGAKVDVPKVEQFAGKLKDENAKGGIMVSNSGFTKGALKVAEHYRIRPVVLIDKGHGDASNFIISSPVVAKGLYLDLMAFGISHQTIGESPVFSPLIWDMLAAEGRDEPRNLYEVFRDHWNDGLLELVQEGSYEYKFPNVQIYDLDGNPATVTVTFSYVVESESRLGEAGAESASGFYDVSTGIFTPANNIEFEPIIIEKVSDWPRIKAGDNVPKQPFQLIGVFPMPDEPPMSCYVNGFTGKQLDPEQVKKGIYN